MRIDDFKYRFTDQPNGWFGATRRSIGRSSSISVWTRTSARVCQRQGSIAYYNWFVYEFWRLCFRAAGGRQARPEAIEFPPMQKGASFNIEAVKAQIETAITGGHGN